MDLSLIQQFFAKKEHTLKQFFELYPEAEEEVVTVDGNTMYYVETETSDDTYRIAIPVWFVALNMKHMDLVNKYIHIPFVTDKTGE